MYMSKITRVTVDDNLSTLLSNLETKKEDVFTQSLTQFDEVDEPNDEFVTMLKEGISSLKNQIESLEIENACVKQENRELNKKIDDLAEMFPSAVTILGKTPESNQVKRNRWIFSQREF